MKNRCHRTRCICELCCIVHAAVTQGSYEMVGILILNGALVEQICLRKWTAMHEAAKVGCSDVFMLLLRNGGQITQKSGHGVIPLGIAAENGHADVMDIIIKEGEPLKSGPIWLMVELIVNSIKMVAEKWVLCTHRLVRILYEL